jgi:hypothetical protein
MDGGIPVCLVKISNCGVVITAIPKIVRAIFIAEDKLVRAATTCERIDFANTSGSGITTRDRIIITTATNGIGTTTVQFTIDITTNDRVAVIVAIFKINTSAFAKSDECSIEALPNPNSFDSNNRCFDGNKTFVVISSQDLSLLI